MPGEQHRWAKRSGRASPLSPRSWKQAQQLYAEAEAPWGILGLRRTPCARHVLTTRAPA